VRKSGPRFVCTDLRVADLSRSVRFYALLGLGRLARYRMQDGTRIAWMRDRSTGQVLELFQLSTRSPLYEPFRRSIERSHALIFTQPDLNGLLARLRRVGARVVLEFTEGKTRIVFLRDPDGAWVEIIGWVDPAANSGRPLPLRSLVRMQRAGPSRPREPKRARRAPGAGAVAAGR